MNALANMPSLALAAPTLPQHRALFQAATALSRHLEHGRKIDAKVQRQVMEVAFGGTDAAGHWSWKDAYEATEVAQVLFLKKFGPAMRRQAGSSAAYLAMLERLTGLVPTQTKRSEESQALQQFSTPLPIGLAVAEAAAIADGDLVLEPSAGTGMLAIFARNAGARVVLNELAELRAELLAQIFETSAVTRHDAATIHDRLDPSLVPSVVVMNPPFSASPKVDGRYKMATARHIRSSLQRLAPDGRLVAVTGASFSPSNPGWRDCFRELQESGRLVFSAPIAGSAYARHGTTIDTRLSVFDKRPAVDSGDFSGCIDCEPCDPQSLLDRIIESCPVRERGPINSRPAAAAPGQAISRSLTDIREEAQAETRELALAQAAHRLDAIATTPISYLPKAWAAKTKALTASLYEPYELQSIEIEGAADHPDKLVQSAAMASIAPPLPSYQPLLPAHLVGDGILSAAQLETIVYAGEAHSSFLQGEWSHEPETGQLVRAADGQGHRIRRGYFLGDGTGCGKGRQVAGVIVDNWCQGRRKAVWISKSDKLIEDARRDWTALGGAASDIVPLSRYKQGSDIRLSEGILFATYATLRSAERQQGDTIKASRLQQITDWLGSDFEGVIAFDEAHAMSNAAGTGSDRGEKKPSQQGRAGLLLQDALPGARVLYVSATGATEVGNLAYASRLGLWATGDFPFPTRAGFVSSMEAGGIAAMEVISRDLKALGLYTARSLSYDGVEYEMLVHELTPAQVEIYDSYAAAFQVIHTHLEKALEAAGVTGDEGTLNAQAKSAARSAFESNKQRFFSHLICAMKCPSLIRSIEADLADGRAAVVQIVSTSEALMERRLAEIPASEWQDLQVDVTPREYVLDYLHHSFPVQLFEPYTDEDGNLRSKPVFDADGHPVLCREAVAARDAMIEKLGALAPVQSSLDQLVWHFGTDTVAEVTGRSRRVIRTSDAKLRVVSRPVSSNIGETAAFQNDDKQVLIFSDAGGTGRSYHADLAAKNQRLRVHYLLEPGWRADNAIQGLGRTHRTNQAQPPLFRPCATDVQGEKRFLSTIARRLDTLGAITRGQRQTGGQGMFRAEDNLESGYARLALRRFFVALHAGTISACSLERFQRMTGLDLVDRDGSLREELPPISRFLNRCLALRIAQQNAIFADFTSILDGIVEAAIAGGTYDVGLETLTAESFRVVDSREIFATPSGARTTALTVEEVQRNQPVTIDEVKRLAAVQGDARLLVNEQSGRAALQLPTSGLMADDGSVIERVRLYRPMTQESLTCVELQASHWRPVADMAFEAAWSREVDAIPEFTTSRLTIVSGLLLPIWDRLPSENMRVYRLQTDEGERIIGRVLTTDQLATLCAGLGLDDVITLSPSEIEDAVMERGATISLDAKLQLRRSRIMDVNRLEVIGFDPSILPTLKALGCRTEIISWKTRAFLPVGDREALERLIDRFPFRPGTTALAA
ncbi:strawberry notch family protein [Notoacmeibacter sp. MSK16QG-6]|uniref:strawberry notch family protein n=1 Tax=Notoacmeibacter sp. MSK16QG-6 TaxID=2957982 RepID=UPI00209F9B5E|nr:strawberry notch family protein [Notoacmeibacter sp. MSK16QG-6]MCP1201072.1 strawberry notch family protein [Notoacmeibacter sp. MSK16QG-6]